MRRSAVQVKINNLRIYQIPEGSEGNDMKACVEDLIQAEIKPMPQVNLQIERAHRSLTNKAKNPTTAPRSLIVKIVDYSVKDAIRQHGVGNKCFTNLSRATSTTITL